MDTHHQRQFHSNTTDTQNELSRDLIKKSQELLKHLELLFKQSKTFNEKALEYLSNSAGRSIADSINGVPDETPEKNDKHR